MNETVEIRGIACRKIDKVEADTLDDYAQTIIREMILAGFSVNEMKRLCNEAKEDIKDRPDKDGDTKAHIQ